MPAYLDTLSAKFPAGFTTSEFRDNRRVIVPPENVFAVLKCLKDECGFDFLADLAGIDYLNYPGATDRYAVVYALANTKTAERVYVKTHVNDPDPVLPSARALWKGAARMEREGYGMYGEAFNRHHA